MQKTKVMDIINELSKKHELYLLNSFDDVAIHFKWNGEKTVAYIKPLGKKERQIEYPDAFDSAQGAEQITKEQYEKL